jgi:isoquinoline 1-oxidoreductase beta subunit
VARRGDLAAARAAAARSLRASYRYGFVSHAQLEPQNCTAWLREGDLEIWAPTQTPASARRIAANVAGVAESRVRVHQLRAGGGFGRRLMNDYVAEAAAIARRVNAPVKLQWRREDDMQHDFFRAGGVHHLGGDLDAAGRLVGWSNHFVSFTADGKRPVSGGAVAEDLFPHPFVDNLDVGHTLLPWRKPCGAWRAPGSNVFGFAYQSFLHELSVAAGRDHLAFLLDLLGTARWLEPGNARALHTGRAANVLRSAAERGGWGGPVEPGRGLGLAFYFSHAGHFAEVADVSVNAAKELTVHRVTVVGDVGPIINLSGAENQCEGSVLDGLSAMLGQECLIENGRATPDNFDRYPLLRMSRTPAIDVHFLKSDFPPTGLGEPALPPLAPAVANAIFAATGDRIRTLPISHAGYTLAAG